MIGVGGARDNQNFQDQESRSKSIVNLIFAIIGCLLVGLCASISALTQAYCSRVGCDMAQSNFDADFLTFCVFFPLFLVMQIKDGDTYNFGDLLVGTTSKLFVTAAQVLMGYALLYGNAGPIQAIDNQKSTW